MLGGHGGSSRRRDDGVIAIGLGRDSEREWAARLMAGSEPWITLGRGLDACLAACRRPEHVLFVARQDGEPVGFVLAHPRGVAGSPYVAAVAVAPAVRGQGVGALLLEHVADHFRAEARHLFLFVSSFNTAARRFYESHGWEAVGEVKGLIVDDASEILMHVRLRR
jgi:ribosomal protein S18 acetylase RimI-like enzyme